MPRSAQPPKTLRCVVFFGLLIGVLIPVSAETKRVPREFPTIKSAVLAARDGDIVEVEDGYYFESNIIVDKNIRLKTKNLLGAVVHGSSVDKGDESIFVIRAAAEVEGFILKNGVSGIVQRGSPDVAWTARDLAILNMREYAVAVNDAEENIGRASLSNIIVDHCGAGFVTNDAHGLEVKRCLVANCLKAFFGFDHLYFRVERTLIWNCETAFCEADAPLPFPRASVISRGEGIVILGPEASSGKAGDRPARYLHQLFAGSIMAENGTTIRQRAREGLALAIAGSIYYRLQDDLQAREFFIQSLRLGQEARSGEVIWRSHLGLAQVFERVQNFPAALENYRKAVSILDSLRGMLPLRVYNPGFFQDKMKVYLSLIHLLFELHGKTPSPEYLEEAIACAEKSRARGFLDSFGEASVDLDSAEASRLREEQGLIAKEISRLQVELQADSLSSEKKDLLLQKLEETEAAHQDLFIRINQEDPRISERRYPKPLGYEEIRQKGLASDTALVEFILGEEYSFAFLMTKQGIHLAQLPGARELLPLVSHYLKFLNLKDAKEFQAVKGGRRLYDLLLGAFQGHLQNGISRIIIVPDGLLCYLPFESLILPENNPSTERKTGRFLIEQYEISYAPSASGLIQLKERQKPGGGEMDLLAIANPKLPQSAKNIFGTPYDLPDLDYALREVREISRFFARSRTAILVESQADEEKLKAVEWSAYRIVHFATHGIVEDGNWKHSGLLLWPGGESAEDGFFQPRDIYLLKLSADLVVLSACQTGRGSLETGEGIIGLTGAFLFAGANSVLVSQWNIADKSTARFMKIFYGNLADGMRITQALREAKMKMIRSEFSHPRYWAAFVLVGDSSRPVRLGRLSR